MRVNDAEMAVVMIKCARYHIRLKCIENKNLFWKSIHLKYNYYWGGLMQHGIRIQVLHITKLMIIIDLCVCVCTFVTGH